MPKLLYPLLPFLGASLYVALLSKRSHFSRTLIVVNQQSVGEFEDSTPVVPAYLAAFEEVFLVFFRAASARRTLCVAPWAMFRYR